MREALEVQRPASERPTVDRTRPITGERAAAPRSTAGIDVVIVSDNNHATLRACVEPLVAVPGLTITVVDNASTDGSLAALAGLGVRTCRSDHNRGFASGCNLGMAAGVAPLVLFLNPDASIRPQELERLVGVLGSELDVGVVGPRLVDGAGKLVPSLGRFQRAGSTWAQALFVHRLLRTTRWANDITPHAALHEQVAYPEWLPGACLLVRRDLMQRLGGFDEGFFLYGEDMDLCARIGAAGYRIRYEPHAVAYHEGGHSAPRTTLFAAFARSRIRFARLHAGRVSALLQHAGLIAGAMTHLVAAVGRPAYARGYAAALYATLTPGRDVR
jgi:N-acetylglucosaminyl-diphospho-decaprenol L-rhamnosyltransferase